VRIIRQKPTQKEKQQQQQGEFCVLRVRKKRAAKGDRREQTCAASGVSKSVASPASPVASNLGSPFLPARHRSPLPIPVFRTLRFQESVLKT